ncbi:hypothetical protein CDD82_4050 [Ophiocordyceps australis]|uniref:Probable 26S proteasome regulatory subunit p27 n=1 Tax=Ophiocordyceps australis TaxID=1399860 RepID=A0A2C5ZAX4_9HYPO|nr:hypothetical protein CDD82_4050 [Ophiocordyceps australis]
MSNIHAPTVPSGPTSNATAPTNGATDQLGFWTLEHKKHEIEAHLQALGSVLDSQNVDMQTPLVTRDGFPRADVDVAQIRTARAQIIRLRNDYSDVMASIEKYLHAHFAKITEASVSELSKAQAQILPDKEPEALLPPFAKVNGVTEGSPAEKAGLKVGDEIRAFGHVNRSNNQNLKGVADCVAENEGRSIFIKVSRPSGVAEREEMRLTLTPVRDWGGRGMLGCHILPI